MAETIYNSSNLYRKENYQEEQSKSLDAKNIEFSPIMPTHIDPLKRLGGVTDQMNSPFQFYQTNNRLRPFNNFGLPFTNEDAINSMLKNYNPFPFQLPGNVPFMGKPSTNGEVDEKLLDTAKMLNYLNHAGNAPLNRQNIFPFQQGDYSKINSIQGQTANATEFHNSFLEDAHDELPHIMKGDHRFDGLSTASLNNRRYPSLEAGFYNSYEDEYGADKAKRFKQN